MYEQLKKLIVEANPSIMEREKVDGYCMDLDIELNLEDVLVAIYKRDIKSFRVWTDGELIWDFMLESERPKNWIMGKPLADQSPEVHEFLYSILK